MCRASCRTGIYPIQVKREEAILSKRLFIAEKPSVAKEFASALGENFITHTGYMESDQSYVTWCLGHLITMSYPDAYDPKYKKWSLDTLPFIPTTYRYEVIHDSRVEKQYKIVKLLLTSDEVNVIYICTDSGREGEYIYRLVASMANVKGKKQLRVWIDSFTESEIQRGIKEAKDDREYNGLGDAAYLRAQEDYLMGINFSRALSLKYAGNIKTFLGMNQCVIAVGRVMTCVLGMVVQREREIRLFQKTPYYRVIGTFSCKGKDSIGSFEAEWMAEKGSRYENSPLLYKENGFLKRSGAEELISQFHSPFSPSVKSIQHKKEIKKAPLLYNLAELQNDCSRYFKLSPQETLSIAQTLYEKRLTTYPRTDARVLSSAIAKEIHKNLNGLLKLPQYDGLLETILKQETYRSIGRTRYTNDAAITDHYAIIPTGEGLSFLPHLKEIEKKVYDLIVRRFLSIFYPEAVFDKITCRIDLQGEMFLAQDRICRQEGYLVCLTVNRSTDQDSTKKKASGIPSELVQGIELDLVSLDIKEGETKPPKRYTGGSMILAMENAGKLIEDESLREQIKGSGIGTSATRAGILEKLVHIQYMDLNPKTQIYTPTQLGEMVYDVVEASVKPLLRPEMTASWEKGLTLVADGEISQKEYRDKLNEYVIRKTNAIKEGDASSWLHQCYIRDAAYYKKPMKWKNKKTKTRRKGKAKPIKGG